MIYHVRQSRVTSYRTIHFRITAAGPETDKIDGFFPFYGCQKRSILKEFPLDQVVDWRHYYP
jgi:hypothetical protein